jgi:hypothetical protein
LLAVAGLALCGWRYGPPFLEGLATPRGYSVAVFARAVVRWIVRVPVFAAALVVLVRRFPRDRDVVFCACYGGVASAAGLIFLGGDGVDWNVMFESNWAWCLTAAVALNRLRRSALAVAFALLPLVAAALAIHRAPADPGSSLASRMGRAPAFGADIAFVASRPGPALCEDLALCFWAGKPAEVDVVNLSQHLKRGTRSPDDLIRLIDARHFGVVQVNAGRSLLDRGTRDALQRSYVLARQSEAGMLFVP